MASRYRWRQQLLGSLQGQLQLATYLVVFLILSSDMAQEGILTSSESSSQRTKTFSVTDTGISIERTIKSESSNHNLLKIQYSILSNSFPNSIQSTTLMIPALAWCRS